MLKKRKAEVALEEIMTVVLGVALLFLILNMFSDNLSKMLQNNSLYKNIKGENKQTDFETFNENPTKTQLNVQIVADQASLAKLHAMARWQVDKLGRIDKSQMNDRQLTDLAKYLTIYAMSGDTNPNSVLNNAKITGTQISFNDVKRNHNITIAINDNPKHTLIPDKKLGEKEYIWEKAEGYNSDVDFDTPEEPKRVQNILAIIKCFNK